MQSNNNGSAKTVFVGSYRRREFAAFISGVARHCHVVNHFATIREALDNEDALSAADLTLVMQSWSDQFTVDDVNRLIGQTLFRRLFCCYSVQCESDGRNRSIWPDAMRVPLRLAASIINRELSDIRLGREPVPPTAARDELFSERSRFIDSPDLKYALQNMNGAVISPDRSFRKTVQQALRELGLKTVDVPPLKVNGIHRIRAKETSRGPVHLVLHDLDPWTESMESSLQITRRTFPSAAILGMATMPDGGIAVEVMDHELDAVIPKLDIVHGLQWHLCQLIQNA